MTGISRAAVQGLRIECLRPWFAEAVGRELGQDVSVELIEGGRSNLTYLLRQGDEAWILRRPPLGHVLATAHDMSREHRVMTALGPTGVPVPRTYSLCQDESVIGAPFYVMEFVDGVAYRFRTQLEPLGAERTRRMCEGLVDVLVTLHGVEPASVGLADFGRAEGFLGRQVVRWGRQMDASRNRPLRGEEQLHKKLSAGVPTESASAIVHGDYRLDNVLVDDRDRIAAVIDWEMATLGDPLTDVALLGIYQRLAATVGTSPALADAAAAPGFLTTSEVLERYCAASGRSADGFGFYLGLAAYKLAAILEGIHYRHRQGQTLGEGFDGVGRLVEPVIDCGLTAMEEYR
jgi:aminoglycoside phosphotransferase (APT) family kinase protein